MFTRRYHAKRHRLCWVTLFIAIVAQTAGADQKPLADDIETPDSLLLTTDPNGQEKQYGSERILIQKGGAKDDRQRRPDPLESSLEPPKVDDQGQEIELFDPSPRTDGDRESTEARKRGFIEREKKGRMDQITPDPLLDSVEP